MKDNILFQNLNFRRLGLNAVLIRCARQNIPAKGPSLERYLETRAELDDTTRLEVPCFGSYSDADSIV